VSAARSRPIVCEAHAKIFELPRIERSMPKFRVFLLFLVPRENRRETGQDGFALVGPQGPQA
jgi:hypothetical protein